VKILGILGSPRKNGNTQILIKEALSAAEEAGAKTDLLNITDRDIRPCKGCHACFKELGRCQTDDDMQTIYPRLLEANGIIIGTPVYFANVSGQTKVFMDRTYCLMPEGKLRNKALGGVASVYRIGGSSALQSLMMFSSAHRMIYAGSVLGFGMEKGDVLQDKGALSMARGLGKAVVRRVRNYQQADA